MKDTNQKWKKDLEIITNWNSDQSKENTKDSKEKDAKINALLFKDNKQAKEK